MTASPAEPRIFWLNLLKHHPKDPMKDRSLGGIAVEISAAEAAAELRTMPAILNGHRRPIGYEWIAAAKWKTMQLEDRLGIKADGYSVAEITREGWEKHMPGAPLNTLLPHDQWVKLGLPVGIHNLLDL